MLEGTEFDRKLEELISSKLSAGIKFWIEL